MNSRSRAICFVVVATWTVVAVPVGAEPVAVAVLNFANQARGPAGQEWNWLEKGLADLLINDLSRHPKLQLVSREQMQLAILRMEHGGGLMLEWQEKISRQLKAARAVFGSYRVDADKIRISATVLDLLKDKPAGQAVVTGAAREVLQLEKQLAAHVLRILTGQADAEQFVAKLPVWTDSVLAAGLLYQGVGRFDQGRYEQAWLHFRRALRQDPNYADATYWAARMFFYQLRYAHAVAELEPFIRQHPGHPRTPDAVREMLEAELMQIQAADQAVALFERLRDSIGDLNVYEPHGNFSGLGAGTMPAEVWLTLRAAQARRHQHDDWRAWQAYRRAWKLARPLWPARPSVIHTLESIRREWDELWVDGRQIASSCPELAFVVGPERGTFVLRLPRPVPADYADTVLAPWLVAPEGRLIMAVTFRAVFRHPNQDSRVNLIVRGGRSMAFVGANGENWQVPLQLTQPKDGPTRMVSSCFQLVRGLRCVGVHPDYVSGDTDRLEVEVSLWPASRTASLTVEGVRPEEYQIRLAPSGKGPNDYLAAIDGRHAARADLFPDQGRGGWRPGRYAVHFVNTVPSRMYRPFRRMSLELKAGRLSRCRPRRVSLEHLAVQRDGRVPRCIADARTYPNFLLANPFTATRAHPQAGKTADGARKAFIPPGYYRQGRVCPVEGPGGRLFAIWHYRQDLWCATSSDGGRSWTAQRRLPLPVNSAHRELNPQVFRDHLGRYCMTFISDRNLLRRLAPYVCTSTDLELWTRPRKMCDGESAYAFMYQDRDNRYVLIQDGRQSVWQRRSSDLLTWSAPSPLATCPDSAAMFRPYVVRGGGGRFHLLVRCVRKQQGGRFRPCLLVSSSPDGAAWSELRLLGVHQARVAGSYALPARDGLLVYADYYLDGGSLPNLARFWRGADGTWWRGGKYSAWVPGSPGLACQTADGRALLGSGDDEGDAWCVEVSDTDMEIKRARLKRVEPKALSP